MITHVLKYDLTKDLIKILTRSQTVLYIPVQNSVCTLEFYGHFTGIIKINMYLPDSKTGEAMGDSSKLMNS